MVGESHCSANVPNQQKNSKVIKMDEKMVLNQTIGLLYSVLGIWMLTTTEMILPIQMYVAGSALLMGYSFIIMWQTPSRIRTHKKSNAEIPSSYIPKTPSPKNTNIFQFSPEE